MLRSLVLWVQQQESELRMLELTAVDTTHAPESIDFGALQALLSIVNLPPRMGDRRHGRRHFYVVVVISPVAVVISPGRRHPARRPRLTVVVSPVVLGWPSSSRSSSAGRRHLWPSSFLAVVILAVAIFSLSLVILAVVIFSLSVGSFLNFALYM